MKELALLLLLLKQLPLGPLQLEAWERRLHRRWLWLGCQRPGVGKVDEVDVS